MIDYNILLKKIALKDTRKDTTNGKEFRDLLKKQNSLDSKTRYDLGVFAEAQVLGEQYQCRKYPLKDKELDDIEEMLLNIDFTPYEMMQLCFQNSSRNDLNTIQNQIGSYISHIVSYIEDFRGLMSDNIGMTNPTIYYTDSMQSKDNIDFGKYEDIAYQKSSSEYYQLFYNEDYHPYLAKNKKKRAYAHSVSFDIALGRVEIIRMFLDILYDINNKKTKTFLKKIRKELSTICKNKHRYFEFLKFIVYGGFNTRADRNFMFYHLKK